MKILREILSPLAAVMLAFLVGAVIILLIKDDPIETYRLLIVNSFGSLKDFGWTLFYTTPLIFTGLAVAVAFRCGLFNIGGEGQLYVASFATAWVGITCGGVMIKSGETFENWSFVSLPSYVLLPLCILTAVVVGGLWGAIPGFLRARFGSSEVINTIMLNFIAVGLISYLTQYHYKNPGPILETPPIGEAAHLAQFKDFTSFLPPDVPLNLSFVIAVLMCVAVYVFLWKTKWGYELRAVGENASAAEYGGISPKKQMIIAMTISGSLAGMVAINEVLGSRHQFLDGFSAELGFLGIAVALLGRNHPLGVFVAALFFGVLTRGEIFVDAFTRYVSKDIAMVLQAIAILFVASLQKFSKK